MTPTPAPSSSSPPTRANTQARQPLTNLPRRVHDRRVFERRRQRTDTHRATTRVLIVDDDYLVAEVVSHTVQELGYAVAGMAGNGVDALQRVIELQPDVILMDVRMPGMNGIETSRKIQDLRPTPIVLLSAYDAYELTEDAIDAGVGAYLRKPPDSLALDRAIGIAKGRFSDLKLLRAANDSLRSQRQFAEQMLNQQQTLTELLELSLKKTELGYRLQEALRILTRMPGLGPAKSAAIFRLDAPSNMLMRAAYLNCEMTEPPLAERIPISHPLYGKAATTKDVVFISQIGDRKLNCCEAPEAHGHYAIPLLVDTTLLGVLALDVKLPSTESVPDTIFLNAVGRIITGLIRQSLLQDITEHNATHDVLTQLPNRLLLFSLAEQALARAQRKKLCVAVVFIDLDGFKPVNDQLGHDAGDQILKDVAARIRDSIRACDCVGRLGGDEFVAVLGEISELETANEIARRISQAISRTNNEFLLSASIGVSIFPRDASHFEDLLRRADQAMYRAKAAGHGRICFADASDSLAIGGDGQRDHE